MRLNITQLNRAKTYGRRRRKSYQLPPQKNFKPKSQPITVIKNASDYAAYLISDHWRKRRLAKLRNAKACEIKCCRDVPLEVHHVSYKRLGAELDGDLVIVCRDCHELIHWLEKVKGMSLRQATRAARTFTQ